MVAGEHVPDRFGELAGDLDAGDLGAALAAEALLGVLIVGGVGGMTASMQAGFDEGRSAGRRARSWQAARGSPCHPIDRRVDTRPV